MIDYKKIKDDSIVIIQNPEELYDINFLIPVRNRKEFAIPMYNSFKKAQEKSNLSVVYTVVEHSETPDHAKFCKKNKINYIWVKSEKEELFNKCLCYNMGALYSNISKYILFHDIDCLVQSDFFNSLEKNISNQKCKAVQCFQQRRVLYCDQKLTQQLIDGTIDADNINLEHSSVDLPRMGGKVMLGAPGGSILTERALFYDVGGYDADLFLANSPEDAYFWEKIDTVEKMYSCEKPAIDIFHMYHPPMYYSNPYINEMKLIYENFKKLSKVEKLKKIEAKSKQFKEYIV